MRRKKRQIAVDNKKQYALNYFLSFDRDRDAYLKDYKTREFRRKFQECENHILRMLSQECINTGFWCRCEYYPNIRKLVLAKLKREKIVKTSWFVHPDYSYERVFWLNTQHERVRRLRRKGLI